MTQATRNGVTIKIVEFTHDDWTQAWDIEIRTAEKWVIVPSHYCPTEADARRIANAAYEAAATSSDPVAIRTEALR